MAQKDLSTNLFFMNQMADLLNASGVTNQVTFNKGTSKEVGDGITRSSMIRIVAETYDSIFNGLIPLIIPYTFFLY